MKKLLAVAFAFLACTVAILSHPAPAEAACYNVCDAVDGGPPYKTVTATGTGSDCATADAALTSKLQQLASADCTYCRFTKVITKSCYQTSTGQYEVQGYATYHCKYRVCEP